MRPAGDYISALKALSNNTQHMLARAARFSRWLDMSSTASSFAALTRSKAMERPEDAKLTFDDSDLTALP